MPLRAYLERHGHDPVMAGDALVVDDDRDGRDALAQLLETHGYTVRQAQDGRVAMHLIAERMPDFLVLDLEMPVMSGWEVLASLQRAGALRTITVVVVSAGASPPPGVAFMPKPCRSGELLELLSASSRPRRADAASPAGHPG